MDTEALQLVDNTATSDAANATDQASSALDTVEPVADQATAMAQTAAQNSTQDSFFGEAAAQNSTKAVAQDPSYGAFLEHTTQPEPDVMAAGDSLLSSAFSTATWLCLILGVIFVAYWLLRRFGPRGIAIGRNSENPRLVGRLMLGQKQHVDLVRVHKRTFLLGVTEQQINLLTEIKPQPGQCFDDEDEDEFTDFAEMLGKKNGGDGD